MYKKINYVTIYSNALVKYTIIQKRMTFIRIRYLLIAYCDPLKKMPLMHAIIELTT